MHDCFDLEFSMHPLKDMDIVAGHPKTHNILGSLNDEDFIQVDLLAFIFFNLQMIFQGLHRTNSHETLLYQMEFLLEQISLLTLAANLFLVYLSFRAARYVYSCFSFLYFAISYQPRVCQSFEFAV